jgi:hypothetical protein
MPWSLLEPSESFFGLRLSQFNQEVNGNVPIDHQSEDTGSGAMRLHLFCASKKKVRGEQRFGGIFKQKEKDIIYLS